MRRRRRDGRIESLKGSKKKTNQSRDTRQQETSIGMADVGPAATCRLSTISWNVGRADGSNERQRCATSPTAAGSVGNTNKLPSRATLTATCVNCGRKIRLRALYTEGKKEKTAL